MKMEDQIAHRYQGCVGPVPDLVFRERTQALPNTWQILFADPFPCFIDQKISKDPGRCISLTFHEPKVGTRRKRTLPLRDSEPVVS